MWKDLMVFREPAKEPYKHAPTAVIRSYLLSWEGHAGAAVRGALTIAAFSGQ